MMDHIIAAATGVISTEFYRALSMCQTLYQVLDMVYLI